VVTREAYFGPVYGLELPPYHFYVSGNAVVHNSKGREWESVKLADDFSVQPREDKKTGEMKEPPDSELRLAYVACTRAKLALDACGLYTSAVS
jgi:ATP-dependent exoDNAse (exonuclease V) beta subunit